MSDSHPPPAFHAERLQRSPMRETAEELSSEAPPPTSMLYHRPQEGDGICTCCITAGDKLGLSAASPGGRRMLGGTGMNRLTPGATLRLTQLIFVHVRP